MTAMTAVTAMHEDVHERACEERQPNKDAEDVGAMLGEQENAADDQKPDQDEPRSRRYEAGSRILVCRMIV
jgi:hypothetical protein